MSAYLKLLLISGAIPFFVSFWPPLRLWRNWRALLYSIGSVVLIFGGWDVLATWRGHWYFNPNGVGSFMVANLPLEEVLFFVVIPFCCIFTWEAIQYIKKRLS